MSARFVCIKPAELQGIVDHHGLTPTETWVLMCLAFEADHRSGVWRGTQAQLGEVAHIDRRNLRARLRRLEECELIECYWPRGYEGRATVRCYLDVVHVSALQGTNHPLRNDTTPDRKATKVREPRKGRNIPSGGTNRPLQGRESRGHRVVASGLVERHALGSSFALGGKDDQDSNRARALGENVIDFTARKNTPAPAGAEAGRAGSASPRAALAGEPHPLDASLPRVSAGGGSEATPVHPRSLNDITSSLAADVNHLRDQRAMGERGLIHRPEEAM